MNGKNLSFSQTMRYVWQTEAAELARMSEYVDLDAAKDLSGLLLEAKRQGRRVFFAGVGTSAAAARKAAHTFCCVELHASFLSPGDAVHGEMGAVACGDIVFLISKGGGTAEMVNLLEGLRAKKALLVAVTEQTDSPLAKASDRVVHIQVEKEPDPFNMLATASTLSVIAFFDALGIWLMQESGFTREQFAVIHPSGAVGDRLTRNLP